MAISRPSVLTSRVRGKAVSLWRSWRWRGDDVECVCCERTFRGFMPDWNRPHAICPGCLSQERHRALWWYWANESSLLDGGRSILHFAPEYKIRRRLQRLPDTRYVTVDLNSPLAQVKADITRLPFESESFDTVICSHVLEHVADDRQALRELWRVLARGGTAYVMVPIDHTRARTYEDAAVTSPQLRQEAYWQADHVRLYARDFIDRLAEPGFSVATKSPATTLGEATARRYGLICQDLIFVCHKARR
jgi:SAM-dependent methyltransferase